jgi:ABC-type multidrug transport system ATPase subunit
LDIKSKIVVDNISFEITESDVFGFIGANGTGESTTMKR